jgi:hypothetical protein
MDAAETKCKFLADTFLFCSPVFKFFSSILNKFSNELMQMKMDVKLPAWYILWSSGLWHYVVLQVLSSVSEEHAARVKMEATCSSDLLVNYVQDYTMSQPRRP